MVRALAMACVLSSLALACSSDGSEPGDAATDATDAATDSQAADVRAPPAPSCKAGDREEWSGTIPNTFVAVAVCSTCGESYVVAANGNTSSEDVTVGNGATSITATVPAGGTATSANIADKPSDGTVSVCRAQDCIPVSPANQKYCNPFRAVKDIVPERIDQGVDYACSGPIYAMGPGVIDVFHNRDDSGWPGGTFMSYKLTAGPASGKTIYLAENVDLEPSLKSGSYVFSGTILGTQVDASPESEIGWGVPGAGYTAEYSCYTEGCDTALGDNFNALLVALQAPSGVPGPNGCCTSATGYPTNWATLVASWQ
ncbi:MAG TPA: hypothetical protein VH054_16835 [Polyangiaceae bacterium]|nr:hypothetical protein [Polyangiaceae bacterium]